MKKSGGALLILGLVISLFALVVALGELPIDIAVVDLFPVPDVPEDHGISFINITWQNFGNQTVTINGDLTIVGPNHAEAHPLITIVDGNNGTREISYGWVPCNSGNFTVSVNTTIRSGGFYDPNPDNNFMSVDFFVAECDDLLGCGGGGSCTGI